MSDLSLTPLLDLLPELRPVWRVAPDLCLRDVLSHTSGLQDYWPQDYSFAAMEKPTTPQAIVDRWAKKPLDFAEASR